MKNCESQVTLIFCIVSCGYPLWVKSGLGYFDPCDGGKKEGREGKKEIVFVIA